MKPNRRILFAIGTIIFSMSLIAANSSFASTTKVGNGNDGADLESLQPITTGPILEARQHAIEKLQRLNIMGVPGLGLLIPEVERTQLMMASQDAHPTGEQSGSLEISEDKKLVYARTFAEPYAATRFFPAAQKLNTEQLVALHIHEALHRALPSDIRENEDVVMHLTMAISSPGASFDRVNHVASLYVKNTSVAKTGEPSVQVSSVSEKQVLPDATKTSLGYSLDVYGREKPSVADGRWAHGLHITSSLGGYRRIGSVEVEPVFRARLTAYDSFEKKTALGPSAYDLQARFKLSEQAHTGIFVRYSVKALDEATIFPTGRDFLTLGSFFKSDGLRTYFEAGFSYSFPGTSETTARFSEYDTFRNSSQFKSILSLSGTYGLKFRHFRFAALADLHSSAGVDSSPIEYTSQDPFRILTAGPEISYAFQGFQAKVYGKWIINETYATLDDLGDLVDRGSGRGGAGALIAMEF